MAEVPRTSAALWPVGPRSLMSDPDVMKRLRPDVDYSGRIADKDQSRVAKGPPVPQPSPTFLMMATAIQHEQGKLFEPESK